MAEVPEESRSRYESALNAVGALPDLERLAGRRVIVVGSTGLIGSGLVTSLLRYNRARTAEGGGEADLVRIVGISRHAARPRHSAHHLAMSAIDAAQRLQLGPSDYVIFVAGASSDYLRRIDIVIESQLVGLERFLAAARNCAGFVFVSSTRVYGRHETPQLLREDSTATVRPMQVTNLYDSHKHFCESLCLWHYETFGTPTTVARLANVYGPPGTSGSWTAIADMLADAERGTIPVRTPRSVRNYCSLPDAAQGILLAALKGQRCGAYNIGSEEHFTALEVAQLLARSSPDELELDVAPEPTPADYQIISIHKARTQLAYAPQLAFSSVSDYIANSTRTFLRSSPARGE